MKTQETFDPPALTFTFDHPAEMAVMHTLFMWAPVRNYLRRHGIKTEEITAALDNSGVTDEAKEKARKGLEE